MSESQGDFDMHAAPYEENERLKRQVADLLAALEEIRGQILIGDARDIADAAIAAHQGEEG